MNQGPYSRVLAERYAANDTNFNDTDHELLGAIEKIGVQGKMVLDLGCGSGRHIDQYLQLGARHVIGIDASEAMIENARTRGLDGDKVTLEVASADALPLGGSSIGLIASNYVLHYLEDSYRGFAEIARVLEPGGSCVAIFNEFDVVPGAEELYNTWVDIRLMSEGNQVIVKNLIKSPAAIMLQIKQAGLTVVHRKELEHLTSTIDEGYPYKALLAKHAMMYVLEKPTGSNKYKGLIKSLDARVKKAVA